MRKRLSTIILSLIFIAMMPATALAIDIGGVIYSDHDYNALRTFLETEVGGVKNGTRVNGASYDSNDPTTWLVTWTTGSDAEQHVQYINWSNYDLSGALDVSNCTELDTLYVHDNSLTSINTTGCTALEDFVCDGNSLTSLDLSTNTSLQWLYCTRNSLTSLDTSAAGTNLINLQCTDNDLTSLVLTGNTNLDTLYCDENELQSLDVSGFVNLSDLSCNQNALTTLNVTGCTSLYYLYCEENNLANLDVSTNTGLGALCCDGNNLPLLDTTANQSITKLTCSDNPLKSLAANVGGEDIALTVSGNGYVGLEYVSENTIFYASATPAGSSAFVNWTEGGSEISTSEQYDLTIGSSYDLTANFKDAQPEPSTEPSTTAKTTVSPGSLTLYVGGRAVLTPAVPGGTWQWDPQYIELHQSQVTIKALKAGNTTIHYTIGWASVDIPVTILAGELPQTGQDYTAIWILVVLAAGMGAMAIVVKKKGRAKE